MEQKITVQTIAVVSKCTDFTEGRGAYTFHRAFDEEGVAVSWVMKQEGIMGTEQVESTPQKGGTRRFNGYTVKTVPVFTQSIIDSTADAKEHLDQITAQIDELEKQRNVLAAIVK